MMMDFIFIATTVRIWYAIPLVVSVSLVYAATHHEQMRPILWRAMRTALWIIGFMLITFILLYLLQNAI